ncbi:unnamed protein product [Orchesella dallaii]|uniref:Uncharacterized protein n=1 Tax=Orchesella dallaii TaxID=48710 RepID=A0ABP1Q5L7_9HEXA
MSRSHYFENLGIYGDESSEELWEQERRMETDKKRSTSTNSDKESDLEVEKGTVEEYRSFSKEYLFDFDFSDCPKTTTTKVLGSEVRVVWVLEGINSLVDLEAVAGNAYCIVKIQGNDGKDILLRFYFERCELVTNDDCRVRYLSLYVDVLKGGMKGGKGLKFVVKVDRLTDSLWTHFNQMPETAVFIRKPEDSRGKLVGSYFLQYLRSSLPISTFRGRVNRSGFLLESTDNLNFGIKVTMINSVTSKKKVSKRMEGVSLASPPLKPVVSSTMEKVLPLPPTVTIALPKSEETSAPDLKNIPAPQEISMSKLTELPPLREPATPKLTELPPLREPATPKLIETSPPRETATPQLMEIPPPKEAVTPKLKDIPRTELKEAAAAALEPKESLSFVTTQETLSTTSTPKSIMIIPADLIEMRSPPKVVGRGRGRIMNIPGPSSVPIPMEESEYQALISIYSSPSMSLVEEDNCFSDEGRFEMKYQTWPWNLPKEDKGNAKLD